MSARPNTARTLNYGRTLAWAQHDRLVHAEEMARYALAHNKLLTPAEISAYKAAIALVHKQAALYSKLVELEIPNDLIPATKRRPGRPSATELNAIQRSRTGRGAAVATAATKTVKTTVKTAKPSKATKAKTVRTAKSTVKTAAAKNTTIDATNAPKRRGRPPKAKTVTVDTSVTSSDTSVS